MATHDLPTGTITFLFSDIEGSTKLLQEIGDAYIPPLQQHNRIFSRGDPGTRRGRSQH
jgi:hypothetical protein